MDTTNILAIDIGGTKTIIGLVDGQGHLGLFRTIATHTADVNTHMEHCLDAAEALLQEAEVSAQHLQGIGVAVPGMADAKKGMLLHAPFSGWRDVPIRQIVHDRFPALQVKIANDVNACALAEMKFGGARDLSHFIWVTVSTGIGAGIVTDGKVLEGSSLIAGELGHVVVEWEQGRLCGCGNKGCLEAQASGKAIEKYVQQDVRKDGYSTGEITAEAAAKAAYAGDERSLQAFAKAGIYLGRGLSYAVNVLNPQAVFVGGGVSRSFDLLKKEMDLTLRSAVIGESNKNTPVYVTELGYHAALLGAAALIIK